jgi:hypothetical protein
MQAGIDWDTMHLFNTMQQAAAMLPEGIREQHEQELLCRRHVVDFQLSCMTARVCESLGELPQHCWGLTQPSQDVMLVCFGGCLEKGSTLRIPHFVSQAEYIDRYIAQAPAFSLPALEKIVYPLSREVCSISKHTKFVYLSNGVWGETENTGNARLVGSLAQLNVFSTNRLAVLHAQHGLHAVFAAHVQSNDWVSAAELKAADSATKQSAEPRDETEKHKNKVRW